ncbi:NAD-dependent epimerase/dehydratase family protein [Halobacterium litoreum]|uniref:NAD-dependent epimerase/dehydratase family protein n=1 Tax=Halobacterium litoreum TaxID=2039234 RepID=A0ABD5NBS8_9EURY|nr:NAD-dependent epimerase/dehydratase family protein [Halobacterium litoreum]UHH14667.1 NAD-dependent epimerase/dehydratase family protein [Halobacterium litoreum]
MQASPTRTVERSAVPEDLRDTTVLVTGGAGFVGSHIADALVEDADVRVLDDFSTGRRENVPAGATIHEGDVRDPETVAEAMAGVDVVFHEAGLVSVPESVEQPALSHDCNATATLGVLEAARREDARVVVASSVAVYGNPVDVPIHEGDPKEPTSPYGVDKLAIDQYARLYSDLYGLETVALRYFNVYGPRQSAGQYSGVISTFLEQAQSGQPLTVEGDGTQTRDFVHVSDVVRANLAAATTDRVGRAFNVGTGDSVTIRELADLVIDATDATQGVVHRPPREGDVERSRADVTRARRQLGYEPTVELGEGLRELAKSAARVR